MKKLISAIAAFATSVSLAFTTGTVPSDGVYKFTFGVSATSDGSLPVPASAVYDVNGAYDSNTFSYGFLGTTATSYTDDIHSDVPTIPYAMDGFEVVSGQQIVLHDTNTSSSVSCVCGPAASEYLPAGASSYEGRYPIRFAMRGEERAYYAVTCTVVNVSSTANADVTLFSERCHIQAHHLALGPGETRMFAWSVELAPNYFKGPGKYYNDDTINVVLVGENAALASLTVVKQPQTSGTVRGESVSNMNVGRTMWLCDDSTGTDQRNATPYFSLQNYSGVGSGLSKYAPASLSIRNQGEGGLATGADTHRTSCLLKPGDYLYVEYGHNESGVTSYTNNLETYLADANTAGAYLVIVSPVERRSSWDGTTSTWNRSLQAISEAGEAWVEDKIAQGATNIAFIDLNKRYNTWMNEEIVRIHNVNSEVSLTAAISYYYRSAKGANVDNTHINNAGTDQAAYWVWYDALQRVEAGEAEGATESQKVQAAVLKGITEGYQDFSPWSVTDDIINAGIAPNSYWDTPVTTGYDYANDAVVADVDATANSDGTVTISGVTMRILNPNNYYKAVIDVVSADGATTNRYYSYYNYDVGGAGKVSGDLVTPEQSGFLTTDAAKDDVSAADCATITVPANGKAYVWFAEADDSTWAVGSNAACSAKYPVEWWSDVLLDDDCSSCDEWGVNSGAIWSTNVVDGAIYFTTTGADSSNTKKTFGLSRALDSAMTNGRYRVTFKAMLDSGTINFVVGDAVHKTTTMPFYHSKTMLTFAGTDVTGYNSLLPAITVDGDDAEQSVINALRWVDVDFIVDRDNERAWLSVGGSEYVEYSDASFLPGSYAGTTWNYFGVNVPAQKSAYGYVDDVKVVKLASVVYDTVTVSTAVNDAAMGSVTINGYATNSLSVYAGNDFLLKATSADADYCKFSCWQDGDGNTVSTSAALYIADATESASYTAVFDDYGTSEDRVISWDFSDYQGDFELAPTEATIVTNNDMVFSLQSGDSMTASGLVWADSALGHTTKNETLSEGGDHYIVYTPAASGTLTVKFSVDSYVNKRSPTMIIKAADSTSVCTNDVGDVVVKTEASDTEYTLSASLTADTTYYIWTYAYNWGGAGYHHNYTIPSITYTYPSPSLDGIDVHNFVWKPTVASGDWSDSSNWRYEGKVQASSCPSDASCDVVTFNSAATVSFAAEGVASNVWFNADVTLLSTAKKGLVATMSAGDGVVTLSNCGFANPSSHDLTISNDVVMVAGTTNWFNVTGVAYGPDMYIRGDISGEGSYQVNLPAYRECNAYFYGNNNDFVGDAYTTGGTVNRSVVYWANENAAGTNTYWHIGHSYGNYNSDSFNMGGSVKFGGYDGAWWNRYDGNVLTIGYLNRDSGISIYNGVEGRASSVVKEGTANLTLGTTTIKNLTVNGGSVTLPIGIAPQTLTVAGGTTLSFEGDSAWAAGTVTNLCAYTNLAGVDESTLASQVSVTGLHPTSKAKISVEDNTVKATIVPMGLFIIVR